MENESKLQELLERIELSTRRQTRFARLQLILTAITSAVFAVLLLTCIQILPQLQEVASQAESVLTNLESVTTELANTDLIGMVGNIDALVENVDTLVNTSQAGVEQTLQKINEINFSALNTAIKDLSDVIEPIAKFFKSFKFG